MALNEGAQSQAGSLNRLVSVATADGRARAVVEDDFHHFRLTLSHDGARVNSIETEAIRHPFSLCGAAGERLGQLVGMPLTPNMAEVFRVTEPRLQCTHQFDLAAIAIAAAARGGRRVYRIRVSDPEAGQSEASVSRDGAHLLAWQVENYAVTAPAPFSGLSLGQGFTDWVVRNLDSEAAEAALVLRRGVFISRGRRIIEHLDARTYKPALGGCWVLQPGRQELARRNEQSVRDFSHRPSQLGELDRAWLRFES